MVSVSTITPLIRTHLVISIANELYSGHIRKGPKYQVVLYIDRAIDAHRPCVLVGFQNPLLYDKANASSLVKQVYSETLFGTV